MLQDLAILKRNLVAKRDSADASAFRARCCWLAPRPPRWGHNFLPTAMDAPDLEDRPCGYLPGTRENRGLDLRALGVRIAPVRGHRIADAGLPRYRPS